MNACRILPHIAALYAVLLTAPHLVAQNGVSSSAPENAAPRYWTGSALQPRVTILEDTLFRVRTETPFNTRHTRQGATLDFTLNNNVIVDGTMIIPQGATLHGTVVESKRPGKLAHPGALTVMLTSLDLEGRTYPLYTYHIRVVGTSNAQSTETKATTGAVYGALAGAVVDGRRNDPTPKQKLADVGAGAAAGAGIGVVAAMATAPEDIAIPGEAQIDFYLASPIAVVPVSQPEAEKLMRRVKPGGPRLYVRGETP